MFFKKDQKFLLKMK